MKLLKIKFILFILVLCINIWGCQQRDTEVGYYVYITKQVDSLPCHVNIEYPDLGKTKNIQIYSDWSFIQKINHDQYVILTATSISNVKTVKVEIYAKENPVYESCEGNCTVSVRKDLYN